jgi:hypothetical protein
MYPNVAYYTYIIAGHGDHPLFIYFKELVQKMPLACGSKVLFFLC